MILAEARAGRGGNSGMLSKECAAVGSASGGAVEARAERAVAAAMERFCSVGSVEEGADLCGDGDDSGFRVAAVGCKIYVARFIVIAEVAQVAQVADVAEAVCDSDELARADGASQSAQVQ